MNKKSNIFIDVSALRQKNLSGVGNYLKNTLTELLKLDDKNSYYLFSFGYKNIPLNFDYKSFKNVFYKNFRIPGKLIFLGNLFFSWPKIDILKFENNKVKADILWLPNMNIFSLRNKKTKLISTIHDLSFVKYKNFFNFKRKLWHFFVNFRKLIKRSSYLICVSNNTSIDIQKRYMINPQKIVVSPLGISKDFQKIEDENYLNHVKQKYNLPDNFLLYVGTIEPRKNVVSLISAFDKLSKDFENLYLVICGEIGWKSRELKNKYKNLDKNTKSKILFLNYFPQEDLPAIYNLAKIFVWPSYYEGFGLPPLEAISCNCVTVASNNSSMPEVLENNAVLIEAFEVGDIYESCKNLLNDEELYNYYKNKKFDNSYYENWQNSAQKLLKLFN